MGCAEQGHSQIDGGLRGEPLGNLTMVCYARSGTARDETMTVAADG